MKKVISLILVFVIALSVVAFSGCNNDKAPENQESESKTFDVSNPVAEINVKDYGTIYVELYYDRVPNTVANFVSLANKGFYDGLTFHRVISGFMIQGGCPDGNGTGDAGYSIKGDFAVNGYDNDLKHTRGVISMARNGYSYDSAGSQFFIMHKDYPSLDGQYASFGMVLEGIEVVDAIAAVNTDINDKPVEDVVISSVRINTNGLKIDEPVTIVNEY